MGGEGVGDGCLDYIWGYFAIIFSPTLGNFTLNPVLGSERLPQCINRTFKGFINCDLLSLLGS